jgi:hypothetical protein
LTTAAHEIDIGWLARETVVSQRPFGRRTRFGQARWMFVQRTTDL